MDKKSLAIAKYKLTPKQIMVLSKLAEGKSSKQVADELGITKQTEEKHRENLYAKLPFRGVVLMTHFAIANGFTELKNL